MSKKKKEDKEFIHFLDTMKVVKKEIIPIEVSMIQIDSSQIESIGSLPEWGTPEGEEQAYRLIIRFHRGGLYMYYGVPQSLAINLINAESPGGFFSTQIKGKYGFQKITATS